MEKQTFKTIGLIGKYGVPDVGECIRALSTHLNGKQLEIILDEGTAKMLPGHELTTGDRSEIGKQCDLAVIIGGDGTMLNAARSLIDYDVPLVGINLGRLGFMVDISPDKMIDYIDHILDGEYLMEERFLLHSTVVREGDHVTESDAFNDVTIHKWNVARMIELETFIDGKFVNIQRSDGLIISTPTGSTAYALSSGGPILHPALNAIALVPVCPHTMSNRPIVVSGNSFIEVVICESNHDNTQVTSDGQITFNLIAGDRVQIRKKDRPIHLIHPPHHNYFEILRAKLRWADNP